MTGLTLTQRAATAQRLDMRALTPERLAGQTPAEIARLPLRLGRRPVALGELFDITGTPDKRLVIASDADNLDGLGCGMREGELIVDGDAGFDTAARLAGGRVEVRGNCGDYAARGMRAGLLTIGGDCGDHLGAPLHGETHGMRGGRVRVGGSAGARTGERMRRGTILIDGDTGTHTAANLIAGTIAVGGRCGENTGHGMRRGSLILRSPPLSLAVGFNANGRWQLAVVGLLLSALAEQQPFWAQRDGHAERWVGDRCCGGQGEILLV